MKKIGALLVALLLIFSLSVVSVADFGDFAGDSDWSSDWGSDWGSDWDSGDNWSWDSDDDDWNWGSDYDDDDWGSSSGSSFSVLPFFFGGGSGGSTSGGGLSLSDILLILAVIAVVCFLANRKGAKNPSTSVHIPTQNRPQPMVNDLADLKARDPGFSEEKFLSDASNLYIQMQNAWTARNLTALRPRLSAALYAQSERQLEAYKQRHQTNHVERVNVIDKRIVGCTKDSQNDIITVRLTSRIVDYVTDDYSGEVIRGDQNKELFMTYQWTFLRSLGMKTETVSGTDDTHCPNCGAPINLNQSTVCEYCGSVLESAKFDWVVSEIRGVSQKSAN